MKKYQVLFYIATLWNLVAAIVALSSLTTHVELFYGPQYVTNDFIGKIFLQTFWVIVFTFGIGYYLVAKNPQENRGIVIVAVLGKLYVSLLWGYLFFMGKARIMALIGGCGDLIFAIFFIAFLRASKSQR